MAVTDYYARGRNLARERPLLAVVLVTSAALAADLFGGMATGRIPVSLVATFLWDGVVIGLVIGIAGVGLSMTYSILGFANFSHGDVLTSGAFAGWLATFLAAGLGRFEAGRLALVGGATGINVRELGISIAATPAAVGLGLVVAAVSTVGLALTIDRLVFRPMRGAGGIPLLIASIGVAIALRYLLVFVFGAGSRGITAGARVPSVAVPVGAGSVNVDAHEVMLVVAAVALMAGVHLLLQRTKLGTAMRAMADNEDLARVTGIPTERVVRATWIVGGGLTGVAGYLIALERGTIAFNIGWVLLLLIFAAVILGGIGSIYGAMVGGLLIGVTSSLSLVWLPSGFTRAAAFAVMILVLLFRPEGVFGGVTTA